MYEAYAIPLGPLTIMEKAPSHNFWERQSDALRYTIAVVAPVAIGYTLAPVPAITAGLGASLACLTEVPGNRRDKVHTALLALPIFGALALFFCACLGHPILTGFALVIFTFLLSALAVFGERSGLVGAIAISLPLFIWGLRPAMPGQFTTALLLGMGWSYLLGFFWHQDRSKRPTNVYPAAALQFAWRLAALFGLAYAASLLFSLDRYAYWILLTIVIVARPDVVITRQRSRQRLAGTFAGTVATIITWALISQPVILLCLATAGLFVFFAAYRHSYGYGVFAITICVLLSLGVYQGESTTLLLDRVSYTVLGCGLVLAEKLIK